MPELRSCTVAYRDLDGEVTAETLYEAAILGMKAMKVSRWWDRPSLKIEVRVRQPENHSHSLELRKSTIRKST